MRAKHGQTFNHDSAAPGYDADVANEDNPVRTGYEAVLDWVAQNANAKGGAHALELGLGTGNLTSRLNFKTITGVDISLQMIEQAKAKLQNPNISFIVSDLLEFFAQNTNRFDCIVSTYAIHHFEADERATLFRGIAAALIAGGCFICGDLIFQDATTKREILQHYRTSDRAALADEIEREFFWDLNADRAALTAAGFRVSTQQFSELSWGVLAEL